MHSKYLGRFKDRYFSMHAKEFTPGKMSVPVGQGILDGKRIFGVVRKTPIRNYFAECSSDGHAHPREHPHPPFQRTLWSGSAVFISNN
jgi:hypothetical protein